MKYSMSSRAGPDLAAEGKRRRAAEEQSLADVAAQSGGELHVDAELADLRIAVAQPALDEAVPLERAARLLARRRLQLGQVLHVGFEPRRAHGARGKPGDAHELDDVLGSRAGQHALELDIGVAFLGDRECRADLHGRSTHRQQLADSFVRIDAARRNERDRIRRDAFGAEERVHVGQHTLEIETRIGEVLDLRGAEVAAGVARMLDDDRVRPASLARPFLDHELDAARVRQDRNQRDVGMVGGEIGKVERQSRAHDDRVDAARAGLAHAQRVVADGAHDVDGDDAAAAGERLRRADLAVERRHVGGRDGGLVGARFRRHQIRMVAAQVDAGDRADRAQSGDGAGEPMRGNADAHSALDDRQRLAAANHQRRKRLRKRRCGGLGVGRPCGHLHASRVLSGFRSRDTTGPPAPAP